MDRAPTKMTITNAPSLPRRTSTRRAQWTDVPTTATPATGVTAQATMDWRTSYRRDDLLGARPRVLHEFLGGIQGTLHVLCPRLKFRELDEVGFLQKRPEQFPVFRGKRMIAGHLEEKLFRG